MGIGGGTKHKMFKDKYGLVLCPKEWVVLRTWRKMLQVQLVAKALGMTYNGVYGTLRRALKSLHENGIDFCDWMYADEQHEHSGPVGAYNAGYIQGQRDYRDGKVSAEIDMPRKMYKVVGGKVVISDEEQKAYTNTKALHDSTVLEEGLHGQPDSRNNGD